MALAELTKTVVPISADGARLFAEVVAASRRDGVYRMIDAAKADDPAAAPKFDVGAMRDAFDRFAKAAVARKPAADTSMTEVRLAGVPATRVRPAGRLNEGTLIYLHGGGFTVGSVRGEIGVADSFARSLRLETFALDYAQAPERPFPAGIDDVFEAVRAVQDERPGLPVLLAGDSAGGSLAISAALRLRDRGLPPVEGIVSVSALLDWRLENGSWTRHEHRCLVSRAVALFFREGYLGGLDPADPAASPALADLTGLPPTLLIVGGAETLLDDSLLLAQNAARFDCDVETHVFEVPHNFIKFAHPSADLAFAHAEDWARRRGFIA